MPELFEVLQGCLSRIPITPRGWVRVDGVCGFRQHGCVDVLDAQPARHLRHSRAAEVVRQILERHAESRVPMELQTMCLGHFLEHLTVRGRAERGIGDECLDVCSQVYAAMDLRLDIVVQRSSQPARTATSRALASPSLNARTAKAGWLMARTR